jgi:hypothetical protein
VTMVLAATKSEMRHLRIAARSIGSASAAAVYSLLRGCRCALVNVRVVLRWCQQPFDVLSSLLLLLASPPSSARQRTVTHVHQVCANALEARSMARFDVMGV